MIKTSSVCIAITGLNAIPDNPGSGLAVARCIQESSEFNGKIIGLSYDVLDAGLYFDETVDSAYLLPYPSNGDQPLLERLTKIYASDPFDILISCLDAELPNLIRIREQLEDMGIQLQLPDCLQLKKRNKDCLSELAEKVNVYTPELTIVSHPGFFYRCHLEGWQYPLVIKGIFYDACVANNAEEAVSLFHRISADWGLPILVQRFVVGEELNLSALGDGKGNLSHPVMMRKYAVTNKGKAWAGVTIHDEKLLTSAEKLVRELKWSGPFEVEMLKTAHGDYYLIEINPRFPAWIYLSAAAGCNLPWILVKTILGQKIDDTVPDIGKLYIRYAHDRVIELSEFEKMTIWGQRNLTLMEEK